MKVHHTEWEGAEGERKGLIHRDGREGKRRGRIHKEAGARLLGGGAIVAPAVDGPLLPHPCTVLPTTS